MFALGVMYMRGENIKQDIPKSIHYYREASNLNNQYAKNNLAIIYKNGLSTTKNISYAIELLKDSVKFDDPVSMYNLAHIYFYENKYCSNNEQIINLLIKSSQRFSPSIILLSLVLIDKYKEVRYHLIENEIKSAKIYKEGKYNNLIKSILNVITKINYQKQYEISKFSDYMYDYFFRIIETKSLIKEKHDNDSKIGNKINDEFYSGFGLSLF